MTSELLLIVQSKLAMLPKKQTSQAEIELPFLDRHTESILVAELTKKNSILNFK